MVAELSGVTHRYGSVTALTDVSLSLAPGQVTALLGPNGAGKTTIVRLLTGLTRPSQGKAQLFGGDPQAMAGRRRMGVMLQIARVPETLTVREHVHLFSSYYPAPSAAGDGAAAGGPRVCRGSAVRQSVGRTEATRAVCAGHLRQSGAALPRRAHRRAWTSRRAGCSGRPCATFAAAGRAILLTTHYLEEADALANRVVRDQPRPRHRRRPA